MLYSLGRLFIYVICCTAASVVVVSFFVGEVDFVCCLLYLVCVRDVCLVHVTGAYRCSSF